MVDTEALQNLEKLNQLRKDGIISDAEFEQSKERLLFGGGSKKVATASPAVSSPAQDDVLGWMILPLERYAQFSGRSSRQEFWMFQIVYVVLFTAT